MKDTKYQGDNFVNAISRFYAHAPTLSGTYSLNGMPPRPEMQQMQYVAFPKEACREYLHFHKDGLQNRYLLKILKQKNNKSRVNERRKVPG